MDFSAVLIMCAVTALALHWVVVRHHDHQKSLHEAKGPEPDQRRSFNRGGVGHAG
jgi:hypothetical protein